MKAQGPKAPLSAVTKDIIAIKVKNTDSAATLRAQLYRVLRKHGIRKGTEQKDGSVLCDNFEWTGANAIFDHHVRASLEMERWFVKLPKDLEHYPYRPRS